MELRENEKETVMALQRLGGRAKTSSISDLTGLDQSAVMRAALSLKEQRLMKIHEETSVEIGLSEEGLSYAQAGLPERRMISSVLQRGGQGPVGEIARSAYISREILPIALAWIRKKGWGEITRSKGELLLRTSTEPEVGSDEKLIQFLSERGVLTLDSLSDEMKEAFEAVRGRNLLNVYERVQRELELTSEGLALLKGDITSKEKTALTSDLIVSGKWKDVEFRRYDVTAAPPKVFPAKKHVYAEFMEDAKRVLIGMGFEEFEGPFVETEFWNFDVLFQAQDHPAREIHDSYVLRSPSLGAIEDLELMKRVKRTHEDGWITGSSGWKYKWKMEVARRLVLRTQTTAVSMRYLWKHRNPPIKMFCLSHVFRPDVLDAKHSMEFRQLEGIVGDYDINLRHLLGFLQGFSSALGLGNVKFKPGYFPFTEPSVESYIRHPALGWVEFVGAGIFREEVLKPLGVEFPVIAWGIGFDRLAMIGLGIQDIRELYSRRLDWLRERGVR